MIVEQLAGCLTLLHGCFHIFEIVQMVPNRAKPLAYKGRLNPVFLIFLVLLNLINRLI